ncbi:hydantoinase B/oxoprolinase family protein [Synechococcus sp. YX-04-1]|uniref:hydantoinase B/oxoprolinase family protein n=1 Tax=Synechococcus sp. YX-04-1 TaxID=3062778 RepID=UPI0026E37C8E|nr:hydantoinase B/oxoprolinase family protein [Synechococcus sp. YX-04-1]MDO6353180.1 hydantoinase B/oxoprolinase family protein [Synechococcus sp. YX-04-1]
MGWCFWIDRGGTFTDLIGRDPEGQLHVRKLLSEQAGAGDPAVSAMEAMLASASSTIALRDVDDVRLGTTVATNALLEGAGASLLLLTNAGLRDQLWIGDQHRDDLFALEQPQRPFLAQTVLELAGRLDARGEEVEPLVLDQLLRRRLEELRRSGLDVAVVALLHAQRNPVHEQRCAALLRELGFRTVVCSHQVSVMPRLVPRGQTALVEGAVHPVLDGYLQQVQGALGAATPLRVMTSSGALQAPDKLKAKDTILSGPAAGMVGAIAAARMAGFDGVPVLGFDMGGTSTDVFCVASADAQALRQVKEQTEIAGLQLLAPRLPIETVAAGGGSVLELQGERLRVGPRSAGAQPGPACYRAGGPLTITDANLLLGRLQVDRFPAVFGPSGDLPPDVEVVRHHFAELAAALGQTSERVASGALQLAVETMAAAIRRVSLHRGEDIRGGVLVAYGGAGGQHACRLADELGLNTVLLHPMAGVLSAFGMGQARQRCRRQVHLGVALSSDLLAALPDQVERLMGEAQETLSRQGDRADADAGEPEVWVNLALRYPSAEQTLVLTWYAEQGVDAVISAFQASHQQRYGYCIDADQALIVEQLNVEVTAPQQFDATATAEMAEPRPGVETSPQVSMHLELSGWTQAPLLNRSALTLNQRIEGPALIAEATGCTVLEPGWQARVAEGGTLLLERSYPADGSPVLAQADGHDPLQAELFRHRFMAIAEQMGEQLRQSSRSVNIRERLDFSCALFDATGALVANAPHIPVHLGSMGDSVRDLLAQVATGDVAPLQPGDTLLSNDPFHGGTHLPDITAISPVFCNGDQPSFFVASRGHHADVGGIAPGSMPSFSRTITDEGLLLRNQLFVRQGRVLAGDLEAVWSGMATPPRNPPELLADLQAQVAANQAGIVALQSLVEREGKTLVQRQMTLLQQEAARSVQRLLLRLTDARHQLALDDGSSLVVQVSLDPKRQRLRLDFSGTSHQRPGNFNAPLAVTRAAVLYVIRCLLDSDIPLNEGCFAPLDLVVPAGCLLNPCSPAAVVAGNVEVSQALCNLLFAAFGAQAAGQGTMNNFSFGNGRCQYYETVAGGGGAGEGFAGSVGLQSHMTNSRLTDPEVLESRYPVRLESFAVRSGSGGQGRWPGGAGLERTIRFLEPMNVSLISGSRQVPPFGLNGGASGACGENLRLDRDGVAHPLPGAVQLELQAGEAIRLLTPGGGGMGR